MKNLLAICLALIFISASATWGVAAEWQLFGEDQLTENDHPLFVHILQPKPSDDKANCLTAFDNKLPGFPQTMVPLSMDQLKLSLIDISPETDTAENHSENTTIPWIELNTGVQATKFTTENDLNLSGKSFGEETDWAASTFILFFGVDVNMGPGYLKSNAFMGHSPESNQLPATDTGFLNQDTTHMDAKGFNALAGYKLNDRITLEAGCGYLEQENKNAGSGEEAWAIYAHAILSLAPGLQVKPGIGQIDFDKDESSGDPKDSFYAGAQWEINF